MMKNLLISFLIVFGITLISSNTINYPPQPEVQAEKSTQTTHKAVKTVKKKKVVNHVTTKKKPVSEPKQAPMAQPTSSSAPGGGIVSTIRKWANYYGVSSEWLIRVAECESTFDPTVINYGYTASTGEHPTGLYQFLPSTYYRYASKIGYGGSPLNAEDSARVAAYAFSVGGSSEWACK